MVVAMAKMSCRLRRKRRKFDYLGVGRTRSLVLEIYGRGYGFISGRPTAEMIMVMITMYN